MTYTEYRKKLEHCRVTTPRSPQRVDPASQESPHVVPEGEEQRRPLVPETGQCSLFASHRLIVHIIHDRVYGIFHVYDT